MPADVRLSSEVDTSGVAAGMATIQNEVSRTAKSIAGEFTKFFAVGSIIAQFQSVLQKAEDIHREAARFGIDAEQLQLLGNVAKQSGVDMGTVARAMNQLEINAQKAVDPTTKQALAMENLGINARAFAALDTQGKVLALADAYKSSAQDGQAFADISQLIGRRSTELIPLLSLGSAEILKQGKSWGVMSNQTVESLDALKDEQEKYLHELDTFFARLTVSIGKGITAWGTFFNFVKSGFSGSAFGEAAAADERKKLESLIVTPPSTGGARTAGGGSPAVGIADISAGGGEGGAGGGGGGGGAGGLQTWLQTKLSGMRADEKINELLTQRKFLEDALKDPEEQSEEHAASQAAIKKQINAIDQALLPLQRAIADQEQRGVEAADRAIQKSVDRARIDAMRFEAQRTGNADLAREADLLETALNFDEQIQRAMDTANDARSKGLELTAQENEALAQQLEIEKEQVLAEQARRAELERTAAIGAQIRDAAGALAGNNLRLGATSDVYAAAVAASRGIQPGTPEYDRIVQQITAQDQLRNLTGQNLSSADQLARDKLVQWYSQQQQNTANQNADQSTQQQIAYWQAIAAGMPPPAGNPYSALFAPGGSAGAATSGPVSALITNSGTTNELLNKIIQLLQPSPGGI